MRTISLGCGESLIATKANPKRNLVGRLSRRVAAPVYVEDQGRVAILVGGRILDGSSVRGRYWRSFASC